MTEQVPNLGAVQDLRERACHGVFTADLSDDASTDYMLSCQHYCPDTKAMLIFTRDACDGCNAWHLSVSFCNIEDDDMVPLPFDPDVANAWAKLMFGSCVDALWIEGPRSDHGKQRQVWHYRLFVTDGWHKVTNDAPEYIRENCVQWDDLHQPANG